MRVFKKITLFLFLPLILVVLALEGFGYLMLPSGRNATETFRDIFFVYDRDLIRRLRPNVRDDFRTIRPDLQAKVSTNSAGFRGAEFARTDPDAFRVLVLGDSVTFGLGVSDEEAWPAMLDGLLKKKAGSRKVQVRNMGVAGYSTFQGRIMFEKHVVRGDFKPDVVVFGFGFNDGYLNTQTNEEIRDGERHLHESSMGQVRQWLVANSNFFRWAWLPGEPQPITCGVPIEDVRANLAAVADSVPDGCELLLVDTSLPHSYVRNAVRETAESRGLAWLAFREVFRIAKGLPAEGPWPEGSQLRLVVNSLGVEFPAAPGDRPGVYALVLPQAAQRPNARRIELNDEGRDGDEKAGDGFWSCTMAVSAGEDPEIGIVVPGLVAIAPEMGSDGLLLNSVHLLQPGPLIGGVDGTPPTLRINAPNFCPWPDLVLLPDPIHASPAGCRLMAQAVAEKIGASEAWKDFVR